MAEYTEDFFESLTQVRLAMQNESDRGSVLVGAALIEWQMGKTLNAFFLSRHPPGTSHMQEQISVMLNPLGEKSILGSAAARARMCRVLGLINEITHRTLKHFFVFRNEFFCHARSDVRLSDPIIKERLARLVEMAPAGELLVLKDSESEDRNDFVCLVIHLYFKLSHEYRFEHQSPQPPSS